MTRSVPSTKPQFRSLANRGIYRIAQYAGGRRIPDNRCDKGLPEFVTLEPAVQFELNQNQRRSTNGSKSY
jgi:hypothetical protein